MQTVLACVYVLDGIATAIGEVGISGTRSSPCQMRPNMAKLGGPRDCILFHPVHVVNNFKFQICCLFCEQDNLAYIPDDPNLAASRRVTPLQSRQHGEGYTHNLERVVIVGGPV
jgi:hypothetical protein